MSPTNNNYILDQGDLQTIATNQFVLDPKPDSFFSPNNLLDGESPVCNLVSDEESLKLNLLARLRQKYI